LYVKKEREDLVVKGHASVWTNAFLAGAESPEVLSGFRHHIIVELHHYPPFQLSSYAYVQIAPWPPHLSLSLSVSSFLSGLFLSELLSLSLSLSLSLRQRIVKDRTEERVNEPYEPLATYVLLSNLPNFQTPDASVFQGPFLFILANKRGSCSV
jgi:hypothetical protein